MELDMYNYVENNGAITKDYMNELTKKSLEKTLKIFIINFQVSKEIRKIWLQI